MVRPSLSALRDWRQGDCIVGERWFVLRRKAEATGEESEPDGALVEQSVEGLVVLSQTCDLVRDPSDRPYVEVAPLVRPKDPTQLREIQRGRRPAYVWIPGVAERGLVADLDRVMTVEKELLVSWPRTPGCRDDAESRALASALARKRARAAFPDDFVALARKLVARLVDKHDRSSPEGEALRALAQIRVRAAPSWDASAVAVELLFILDPEAEPARPAELDLHLARWLALMPAAGRFGPVEGRVVSLDDLSAREYLDSDPLDLEHLSSDRTASE